MLFRLGDYRGAMLESAAAADLGVVAAALLQAEQAREVGWHHRARRLLEGWLSSTAAKALAAPDAAAPDLLFNRQLETLIELYCDAHHYDGAAAALDRFLPAVRGSAAIQMRAAQVCERCNQPERARAVLESLLSAERPGAATLVAAAQVLTELGDFDAAHDLYERLLDVPTTAPAACEALGRLHLWRGDTAGALEYAERLLAVDAGNAPGLRIRAAALLLDGHADAALTLLDAALTANPRDGEALVWRAEANLRLDRMPEAQADADRSLYFGHTFAARAIRLLAVVRSGRSVMPALWQEILAEVSAVSANAATIIAGASPHAQADLLERALRALRGNRTPVATWVRDDGGLARLPRTASARVASRVALEIIKVATPEETLQAFEEVRRRFPESSMPLVHRGELNLWLGRYPEARADLEAAIDCFRYTRWAWYGLACLDLVAGDPQAALATCARGIEVMNNTEGPVAFLYRGEAYRCLGRLDVAREQLQRSCELNPTRLSAWVNLALVCGGMGDERAQQDLFVRIAQTAPALLSEAAAELGADVFAALVLDTNCGAAAPAPAALIEPVLLQVLAMMRGNRSSSCITYFTSAGDLRHVPQRPGGQRGHGTGLGKLREVLMRILAGA